MPTTKLWGKNCERTSRNAVETAIANAKDKDCKWIQANQPAKGT